MSRIPWSERLNVGESCLLVGVTSCGMIRRLDRRRFRATDRAGRFVGEFASQRGAQAAIVKANTQADRAAREAARNRVLAPAALPRPSAKAKRRRRPGASIEVRVGSAVTLSGPNYSGRIEHTGRRRFVAAAASGAPLGIFTSLRRALDAIRVGAGDAPPAKTRLTPVACYLGVTLRREQVSRLRLSY